MFESTNACGRTVPGDQTVRQKNKGRGCIPTDLAKIVPLNNASERCVSLDRISIQYVFPTLPVCRVSSFTLSSGVYISQSGALKSSEISWY